MHYLGLDISETSLKDDMVLSQKKVDISQSILVLHYILINCSSQIMQQSSFWTETPSALDKSEKNHRKPERILVDF